VAGRTRGQGGATVNASTLKEAALWYAEDGWPVVPLHSIQDGACTCKRSGCSSPGKHPRTRHGLRDATTNPAAIAGWWRRWPTANIGVVTGAVSGMIVLDIDPRHGGDESLAELIRQHGELPERVEAQTGGGGRHLIFAHPGDEVPNRANIRPGIDVRGDGGYIVAPPSVHISGRAYSWRPGHAPDELKPAPMPTWLRDLLTERRDGGQQQRPTEPPVPHNSKGDELARLVTAAAQYVLQAASATEGNRNTAAFNLAGHLFAFETDTTRLRLSEPQVLDLMRAWNHHNTPPLGETELAQVVSSAFRNGTPRPTHEVHAGSATAAVNKGTPAPERDVFRPFPVDVLPEPVRGFVVNSSKAIGCDPSFVALPLLSALAAAIGNTRRIQLKRGWTEPCIVWAVIVGDSGTLKTPAYKLVLRPVRDLQGKALKEYGAAQQAHEAELLHYEKELAAWKRSKTGGEPPAKPEPPRAERMVVSDITTEALAPILLNNPRGVLLARDELAGWIGSFDRYASGKGGADAAHWLSMHNGESIVVDRKTGTPRTIFVPSASVSVTGGIQPGVLDRALGHEHRESGLLARLLLAMPPRRTKRWTEAEISPLSEAAVLAIFERLRELQFTYGENGELRPVVVSLTPAAKEAWVEFYNAHAEEHADLSGDLSAAWSKLEGYAARLALVVHFIRWAADDPTLASSDAVDEVSIAAGVALSRWFGNEARRVYAALGESDEDRDRRRLVEWIERHGGAVTVRELTHGLRQYRGKTDAAREALDGLAKAGFGRWVHPTPDPSGGRPSSRFELVTGVTVTETPADDTEKAGFGSGDGGDSTAAADPDGPAEERGQRGDAVAPGVLAGAGGGNDWGEL